MFEWVLSCQLFILFEMTNSGPATITVELDSFDLDTRISTFDCQSSTPQYPDNGGCNIDIFIEACSIVVDGIFLDSIILEDIKMRYANRYEDIDHGDLFEMLIKNIQILPKTMVECYKGKKNRISHENTIRKPSGQGGIKFDFVVKNWIQKLFIWIGVKSKHFYPKDWPDVIWYAEKYKNDILILDKRQNFTYVKLTKESLKYGKVGNVYKFHYLSSEFTLKLSYICDGDTMGVTCSMKCTPSESHTCDFFTGNQICRPGWLSKEIKSNLIIGPPYLQDCYKEDECYDQHCDDSYCILDTTGAGNCTNVEVVIDSKTTCIPIFKEVKCSLKGELPDKVNYTSKWVYDAIDSGVVIKNDSISFEQPILASMSYNCVITLENGIATQYLVKTHTFMAYNKQRKLEIDIYDGIVTLGQNIRCTVAGWFPSLTNCVMAPTTAGKLILDNVHSGTYRVNTSSNIGESKILVTAILQTTCRGHSAVILVKEFTIYVKGYLKFDFKYGSRNVFYQELDRDFFSCIIYPKTNVSNVSIHVLEKPLDSLYSGFPEKEYIPGVYNMACKLTFNGSSFTETIYNYAHLYYTPTNQSLFVMINETMLDVSIKCIPLPFPVSSFLYSISMYDHYNRDIKWGSIDDHSVDSLPFDIPANLLTLIICRMVSKTNKSVVIQASRSAQFSGWQRPVRLRFWRTRIWPQVFFATALILLALISLTWLIHIKSTGSMSGAFLTKRTLILTNLKRRNTNFYNQFLEWTETINSILISVGTLPMNIDDARRLVRTNLDLTLDFYLFLKGKDVGHDHLRLQEKSRILKERLLKNQNYDS